MSDKRFACPHDEDPELFREAVRYSEASTRFTVSLIEKDYYCSLILRYLFGGDSTLVFRGGSCLSKVHVGFYRLSEDLDFVIPVREDATRIQRRDLAQPIKSSFEELAEAIPGLRISGAIKGHNESRQYIGYLEYDSAVIQKPENIKIEVSLREDILKPVQHGTARTLVVNPFTNLPLLSPFTVRAMDLKEAYAEKFRAAVTRREPAIRDFFDLVHAVREKAFDPLDAGFISMVKTKLRVEGNAPVPLSAERRQALSRQMDAQLRPVLRPQDLTGFSLDDALELVGRIEGACLSSD